VRGQGDVGAPGVSARQRPLGLAVAHEHDLVRTHVGFALGHGHHSARRACRWDDRGVRTLPASWYHDPEVYERERTALFGREWLMVGRASQLQSPGDYLAVDLCGWNVLVI